jgi:outer membrane translocation and assembly module TamA
MHQEKQLKNIKGTFSLFCLLLICFSFVFSSVFTSCTPERKLKEMEYLLVKNKLITDSKDILETSDMEYAIRPRPNKRTFGLFLWKVGTYQAMIPKEKPRYDRFQRNMRNTLGKYPVLLDTLCSDYYAQQLDQFRLWIQNTFGEAPVLLDTSLIEYSLAQLTLMMNNRGYFDAKVDYKVKIKRQQRAVIKYLITAGKPYRIKHISYQVSDPIAKYVYQDTARYSVQSGSVFSVKNIEAQRDRITELLLNRGYYNFSKHYIRYEVDTNMEGEWIDLRIVIADPIYRTDDSTMVEGKHRCFIINSIRVYPDYGQWDDFSYRDSLHYTEIVKKRQDTNTYIFCYSSPHPDYRPFALVYPVSFAQGDVYSNRASRSTYDRYASMRNFDFIKIAYTETDESKQNFRQDTGYLDCQIQLTKTKKQSFNIDLQGKNTGGIFGVGGGFSFTNRNIFKAAEVLSISLKYTQELRVDSSSVNFQNFELGGTVMLEFPRFLFPFVKQRNIPKAFRPKTWMSLGASYLKQDLYERFLTNFTFSYEWRYRNRIKHTLSALDFNLVKMYRDSLFDANIARYGFSKRVLEKYKDHFLLGSNYKITIQDAYRYVFWVRFDLYGNLLYGAMEAFKSQTEKYKNEYNQYSIWKIPFASGLSLEMDFVYNFLQKKKRSLVYHLTLGIGMSTMNSSVLPFEKSFYLGGSNSMRGWRLRSLGPGSYIDTTNSYLERVGDIKFETNLEYRVPIYKALHLGLFLDAGNIWMFKKSDALPNSEFAFNRFFKEIALDAGIGFRLDLSFFIIRLDYALKIHDPGQQYPWRISTWNSYKSFRADRSFVLGIGYPF